MKASELNWTTKRPKLRGHYWVYQRHRADGLKQGKVHETYIHSMYGMPEWLVINHNGIRDNLHDFIEAFSQNGTLYWCGPFNFFPCKTDELENLWEIEQ